MFCIVLITGRVSNASGSLPMYLLKCFIYNANWLLLANLTSGLDLLSLIFINVTHQQQQWPQTQTCWCFYYILSLPSLPSQLSPYSLFLPPWRWKLRRQSFHNKWIFISEVSLTFITFGINRKQRLAGRKEIKKYSYQSSKTCNILDEVFMKSLLIWCW